MCIQFYLCKRYKFLRNRHLNIILGNVLTAIPLKEIIVYFSHKYVLSVLQLLSLIRTVMNFPFRIDNNYLYSYG